MQRFFSEKIVFRLRWIILCILFPAFYIYFFSFNKFHLFYLEQIQLFRFSSDYFQAFHEKPGEFIFYLGEFLTQFFVNPYLGAGIVTLVAAITCFLSHLIFKKLGINAFVLCLVPVLIIEALQSNHLYKIGLTIGIILALSFAWLYLRLTGNLKRYIIGGVAWFLLYHLSGSFALFASLLAVLFEMLYFNSKTKWIKSLAIILVSIGFPYLAWKFFYLITFRDAWFYPFPFWGVSRMPLFAALLVYFPVIISILSVYKQIRKKEVWVVPWNYTSILIGSLVVIVGFLFVKTKAYDPKIEIFLGMDHYVQTEDWNKVIGLSKTYPGTNQLVIYYTNLALYKTGQFSDRMFDFPQNGINGLRLKWVRDEVTPFFGGEIFYHLNYINEAYRWAFESMVAKGLNPRSLKRLVLTSLINRHYEIAARYLNVLDETMFYKDWATQYKTYVSDTAQISQNKELAGKRHFLAKHDFISYDLGLNELLQEHPDNKMAFEYQMAVFLLNKDIANFAANIYRLKELGYREIPVNYEEALLFCMTYFKKDLVPDGYSIRPATIQRKNDYIAQISRCGGDRERAARELYNQFGKTCWYYLHFAEQTNK
ncbi:MAG: hypothetical protein C0397_00505 [Odoribacter sp.]|nr:hypothetical protein [Odoribacter sp.]